MSIDRVLRRALNGVQLPRAHDLHKHYSEMLLKQPGPIGGPEFYSEQRWELGMALKRVMDAVFEPSACGFVDARGDALLKMSEIDFAQMQHALHMQISNHFWTLYKTFNSMYDTVSQAGGIVLCSYNADGTLAVGVKDEDYHHLRRPWVLDENRLGEKPVERLCVLEPSDSFYPEQPVALYKDGVLRSCGFGRVRGEKMFVYRKLLSDRIDVVPVNDGVHIVPLRAKKRAESEPEISKGPYR